MGDRVVVKFISLGTQTAANWSTGKVIGFETNPKACVSYVVEIRNLDGSLKKYWSMGKDGVNTEVPNNSSWKYRLFSGQDYPVTFLPTVVTADRIPSKAMEWIAGESAILGLPVTPKFQSSKVSSIDEEVDRESVDTSSGVSHDNAVLAAKMGDNPITSSGATAWANTETLKQFLVHKVNGIEIIDPPFLTLVGNVIGNSTWGMTHTLGTGYSNYVGTEEILYDGSTAVEHTYMAIGDGKFAGYSYFVTTSRDQQISTVSFHHLSPTSYSKIAASESSKTFAYGPLMYGSHEIHPACSVIETAVFSGSMSIAPVSNSPLSYGPASGSYIYGYNGKAHDFLWQLGNGDEEFCCEYWVIDWVRNNNRTVSQAEYGLNAWNAWPGFENHGDYGSFELTGDDSFTKTVTYKLAFRTKGAITQITLGTSNEIGDGTWKYASLVGRECDTHFLILHTFLSIILWGPAFYTYELIVINKITGGYERIPLGDETTWGQNIRIALKGIGPDAYTPPPPSP